MAVSARRTMLLDPHARRQLNRGLLYAFLGLGGVVTCFPFVWMILTSFKTYAEAIATPPTIFPAEWGVRLGILGAMLWSRPVWVIAFAAWLALGIWVSRRIRDARWRALYLLIHTALFFAVGLLDLWGDRSLAAVWQAVVGERGAQLKPFWDNYVEAWDRAPFAYYFRNSIIMSVATPLLIVVTSAPAAYAFARMRFPGANLLFMLFLATMMVPSEVVLIPNFITVSQLGWKNTFAALVVPYAVSVLSIFFLRQFFKSVPDDLFDAATIDGCGHTRFLLSIALPLAQPALVSTGMFNFLSAWNSLLWPLLVTDEETMRPLALGLASFSTEAGTQFNLYMAAASFTIVPVIVLFLFVQEQFIEGIARTGIK
ncbi:MAG: ABC transporter permease subunit [Anaerolineae bacterium]|jgi:ABC-type glycerol-3-phosphate transport system permease component